MSQNVQINRNLKINSVTYGESRTVTLDTPSALIEVIGSGITDKQVIFPVDYSQLQVVCLHSTQNLTLETNSGSSPTDTISRTANVAKVWYTGESSCPFTADCTNIYVTNATGSAATLTMVICYDSTP